MTITDAARAAASQTNNNGLTMPRRQHTRAQDRNHRIADHRRLNEAEARQCATGITTIFTCGP